MLECDDTISDIRSLVIRLLTEDTALAPWLPFRIEKQTVSTEGGVGLNVKVISLTGKGSATSQIQQDRVDQDVYAVFGNAINHIIESGVCKDGVLFIIDEIDRVKHRSELASLIRSRGTDSRVKFALIGVGTTPQELILNHESIVRQISDGCVEMPPMSGAELAEIFDNAHRLLHEDDVQFTLDAQNWIISIAKGHPYYVHLICKHSLIKAVISGEKVITESIAKEALADIALNGTARVQETIYQKSIGHSYTREYILKELASVETEEINTTATYQKISSARNMDISSISVYVGQLASEKFGSVIEKTRERHYRFKDSLFKAYAAARPHHYNADQLEKDD